MLFFVVIAVVFDVEATTLRLEFFWGLIVTGTGGGLRTTLEVRVRLLFSVRTWVLAIILERRAGGTEAVGEVGLVGSTFNFDTGAAVYSALPVEAVSPDFSFIFAKFVLTRVAVLVEDNDRDAAGGIDDDICL